MYVLAAHKVIVGQLMKVAALMPLCVRNAMSGLVAIARNNVIIVDSIFAKKTVMRDMNARGRDQRSTNDTTHIEEIAMSNFAKLSEIGRQITYH